MCGGVLLVGGQRSSFPNQPLQPTAAAMLVFREVQFRQAAPAAELGRSATK
jgi:hypothetical protein